MSEIRSVEGERPTAVLVGVHLPDVTEASFRASLDELGRLADTLGLHVVGRITQRRGQLARATVVGEGKLRELARVTGGTGVVPGYERPGQRREEDAADPEEDEGEGEAEPGSMESASVVLVDHELSPSQMRNLEKSTGAEVMDRSMVILAIFQRHARTREAKLQVELAHLAYMAPRLRESHAGGDRQRGGIGGRGAGESALELDRRRIRDRMAELKEEIEDVQRESDTRRQRRTVGETPTVALVGYTNAGKSSLMRALTGDTVYVADQLFATLDTTVRALMPETRPRILVSDTVGFIKRLPHDLVASFRSTLEEARDADLLLHVVDASDPNFREQMHVTEAVLQEVGAGDRPARLLLNKADRLDDSARAQLTAEFPEAILLSAKRPEDVAMLHGRIVAFFDESKADLSLLVPYAASRVLARCRELGRVLSEEYEDEGVRVVVRASPGMLEKIKRELESSRVGNGA
ncbi:MAG: GTPase HflX [Pseudomonadota bacterium]